MACECGDLGYFVRFIPVEFAYGVRGSDDYPYLPPRTVLFPLLIFFISVFEPKPTVEGRVY